MTGNPEALNWFRKGGEFEAIPDYVRAEGSYRKALELDPENPDFLSALAGVLIILGEAEEALLWEKRLLEQNPSDSTRLGSVAQLLLSHLGRPEEAVEYYRRAVFLSPLELRFQAGLARALSGAGHHEEAGRMARGLVDSWDFDSEDDRALALGLYSEVLERAGSIGRAIDPLRAAADLSPNGADYLRRLSDLLMRSGDWEETLKTLRREATEFGHRYGGWRAQGVALERLGRLDEAARAYQGAIELDDHYTGLVLARIEGEADEGDDLKSRNIWTTLSAWPVNSRLERAVLAHFIGTRLSPSHPSAALLFFRKARRLGFPAEDKLKEKIRSLERSLQDHSE